MWKVVLIHSSAIRLEPRPDDHHSGASTPAPAGRCLINATASSAQETQLVITAPVVDSKAMPKLPTPPGSAPTHLMSFIPPAPQQTPQPQPPASETNVCHMTAA